jgi:hypothetical protein
MASTTWDKAIEKQDARRQRGWKSTLQDEIVNGLDGLIDTLKPPKSQGERNSDTTAIGYLPASVAKLQGDFTLFVVFKGSTKVASEDFLKYVPGEWGKGSVVFVPNDYQEVGTHAEIQILMYLQFLGHDIKGLGAKGLRIACGSKGCCPDCAGYLAKHKIYHTKSRDTVAAQWRNPRTESLYRGTGDSLLYSKPGMNSANGMGYVSKAYPKSI